MSSNRGGNIPIPPTEALRSSSFQSLVPVGGDGASLLRTISFRVHDRSSTATNGPVEKDSISVLEDMSNLSRSLALSPRGGVQKEVNAKTPNTFSTVKFLCATLVGIEQGAGDSAQAALTQAAGRMDDKNRMDNVGTVFSRSTILCPTRIASSRYCASRNVRVLELPITKRMSVPFDDVGVVTDGRKSKVSDQESGVFIRRTNSDVIWGDTVFSSTQPRKTLTDESKKGVGSWPGTSSISLGILSRAPVATMAQSSVGGASESRRHSGRSASSGSQIDIGAFGMNKAHRRRPIIPALDQMALDLRAGWMGEDDVEEELQELTLFNAMANTKLNRSGEQISSFLIGQHVVANEDLDYFCGIVPAGTKGVVTKIVNWRLHVKWSLRNFEKYPDCEVCGTEVSPDTANMTRRIQRKGTVIHMEVEQSTKVDFNMDVEMIEPNLCIARESRATAQSSPRSTKNLSSK